MEIYRIDPDIGYGSNTYLIVSGTHAAIVAPAVSYDKEMPFLKQGIAIDYIVTTHAHFDHILKTDEWRSNTGAEVIVGQLDASALSDPELNCYKYFFNAHGGYFGPYKTVSDGDELFLGDERIRIMETPGHTVGSITLLLEDGAAIVGDVVFAHGGIGRTDLPGGDYLTLMCSIRKILSLGEDTVIYPGHGDTTTVKEIKNQKR